MAKSTSDEALDEAEVARRSEATLKRLLTTPHKNQADMNVGKPSGLSAAKRRAQRTVKSEG